MSGNDVVSGYLDVKISSRSRRGLTPWKVGFSEGRPFRDTTDRLIWCARADGVDEIWVLRNEGPVRNSAISHKYFTFLRMITPQIRVCLLTNGDYVVYGGDMSHISVILSH